MIKLAGKISKIFEKEVRGSGDNPFVKRRFWLDEVSDKYPCAWELELWKEDCPMLDNFNEGDFVTCYVDIKGQQWSGKDGVDRRTMTLKCWNFEKDGKAIKEIK